MLCCFIKALPRVLIRCPCAHRLKGAAPAVGRVTYVRTPERAQTSVTLQDGCFGVGTLIRLAAMFVSPDGSEGGGSEQEPEQAPGRGAREGADEAAGEPAGGEAAEQLEAASLYSSAAPTGASSGGLQESPQRLSSQPRCHLVLGI